MWYILIVYRFTGSEVWGYALRASTPQTGFKVQCNAINLRIGAILVGAASSRDWSFRATLYRGWKPLPPQIDLKLAALGSMVITD